MPKTIHTPRDELVCGKLDELELHLSSIGVTDCIYLIASIRNDCERMEAKLAERKKEIESYQYLEAHGCDPMNMPDISFRHPDGMTEEDDKRFLRNMFY